MNLWCALSIIMPEAIVRAGCEATDIEREAWQALCDEYDALTRAQRERFDASVAAGRFGVPNG